MKKLYILLTLLLTAVSCNTQQKYITESTDIQLSVQEKLSTASKLTVDLTLENDKTYYFCGILPAGQYVVSKNNLRFMQLCLDYLYKDYIEWRFQKLVDNEEYVASFAGHCLLYGNNTKSFTQLEAGKDYLIFAFCVNPETNEPMGEMQYVYASTRERHSSNLTVELVCEDKDDGPYVTLIPSNDEEDYFWDYVNKEEYHRDYTDFLTFSYDDVEYYIRRDESPTARGFDTYNAKEDFLPGTEFYVIAAGYDGDFTTPLIIWEITYPFTEIHRIQ
ncbi:MAG: hypothetical protein Q4D10_02185 [Bacteroidales bacterium]|nr:hypothetical protein [Bacteroidales bacterium]MDD6773918.1 hypothetical protein [Bacteroidales bacterium]MDO4212931.1 hypothetical protein [Bacteroidales bacterium]